MKSYPLRRLRFLVMRSWGDAELFGKIWSRVHSFIYIALFVWLSVAGAVVSFDWSGGFDLCVGAAMCFDFVLLDLKDEVWHVDNEAKKKLY